MSKNSVYSLYKHQFFVLIIILNQILSLIQVIIRIMKSIIKRLFLMIFGYMQFKEDITKSKLSNYLITNRFHHFIFLIFASYFFIYKLNFNISFIYKFYRLSIINLVIDISKVYFNFELSKYWSLRSIILAIFKLLARNEELNGRVVYHWISINSGVS